MSSSLDAGYAAQTAAKQKKTKCTKSKDGKHKWKRHGLSPSTWEEVLDADAFSYFKKNGIFDKATADSFRKNILERGGTDDAMKLYRQFTGGKDPDVKPLLERRGLN